MTEDVARLALAALATGLWLASVLTVVLGVRRARRAEKARSEALAGDGGDATLIAYASQTGLAEELAWMTARALSDAGWPVRVVSFADLDLDLLKGSRRALFVVSTTGEGDAPDSAGRVVRTLLGEAAGLDGLSYGVLSLGDLTYRDYCGFGRALEAWLRRSEALPLFDTVEVDDGDPAAVRHWQHQLNQLTGATTAPDWTPPAYDRWRLAGRTHINPGSPGGEAFHVVLEPIDGQAAWVAGDIAEIGVPTADGGEVSREYSIASLPSDGRLELLVRLMRHPDGTPGLGSGRLALGLTVGDEVPLRVRTNSAFHAPAASTPMILIGNGTGIAGLRAHLKSRTARDGGAWLLFGERTAAHDAFFDDELQSALATGILTRLDRAFSRDPDAEGRTGRYVQHLIDDHAEEIAAWVERGAAIYVCGSLDGMASGVHAALENALGPDRLIDLSENGRYRRDVY